MAKENTDRTTIDLFADDKRPGRPKTNPLSRKDQLKVNKRNQLKRDRNKGLKRIELKVESELLDQLNELAKDHSLSRSEFITQLIRDSIEQHKHRSR